MSPESRQIERVSRQRPRRPQKGALPDWLPFSSIKAMITGASIGLGVVLLLAGTVLASFYLYFQVSDRIVLGVQVGEVALGNEEYQDAVDLLSDGWEADRSIRLLAGDQSWATSAANLGIVINAEATAQRALDVAHGEGVFKEMGTMLDAFFGGYAVEPVVMALPDVARVELDRWVEHIYRAPQNATIRIEGGSVVEVPGVDGYILDVDRTLEILIFDPGAMARAGELPVILLPIAPNLPHVPEAVAEAESMLSRPLTIVLYDAIEDERQSWVEERGMIGSWLGVEESSDGPRVIVEQEMLAAYVETLSSRLEAGEFVEAERNITPLENALRYGGETWMLVSHLPSSYTVQAGDTLTRVAWKTGIPYWRILDANPGIEPDTLSVGQVIQIPSPDDLLPLDLVAGKRIVVDISDQRLWTYENGALRSEHVISTGIEDSPTQPGVFPVQTHFENAYASVWNLHMPNFIGIYESWPGFMNGFHGLPTRDGGQILWANSLGSPVSYGCIILDSPEAESLYVWAEEGVVVEIRE